MSRFWLQWLILVCCACFTKTTRLHQGYFTSSPQNVTVFVGSYVSLRWDFIVVPEDALRKVTFDVSPDGHATKGLAIKVITKSGWKVLKNPKYPSYHKRLQVDEQKTALTLSNLAANDSGYYGCVLDIGLAFPAVTSRAYVKVTDILMDTNASSTSLKTWYGRKVRLVCATLTVSNPDFKWYRRSEAGKVTELTKNIASRQGRSVLKFEVLHPRDFAQYICVAKTAAAVVRHDIMVRSLDPPGAPYAVEFRVWADTEAEKGIELRWMPPEADGGLSITNYTVEKRELGHDKWRQALITSTSSGFLSNLHGMRNYQIRVQANNDAGSGPFSEILDVALITPSKPRNIVFTVATVDGTKLVRLAWDQPEDNDGAPVLEYIIEKRVYGTKPWRLATKTQFTYIDVFLAYSQNHQLRILTRSIAGKGEPSEPLDIIWIKPGPPKNVQFWLYDEDGAKSVNITWRADEKAKASVQEFIVKKRAVGDRESGWVTEARTRSTSYLIKNLDTSNNYDIKVFAVNSHGSSRQSRVLHIPLAYTVSGMSAGSEACSRHLHWPSITLTLVALLVLL